MAARAFTPSRSDMVADPATTLPDPAVAIIVEALGRLRYGDIRLTVHDGRLVQVDVTERTRFAQT